MFVGLVEDRGECGQIRDQTAGASRQRESQGVAGADLVAAAAGTGAVVVLGTTPEAESLCSIAAGIVSDADARLKRERPMRSFTVMSAPRSRNIANSSPSSFGGRICNAAWLSSSLLIPVSNISRQVVQSASAAPMIDVTRPIFGSAPRWINRRIAATSAA